MALEGIWFSTFVVVAVILYMQGKVLFTVCGFAVVHRVHMLECAYSLHRIFPKAEELRETLDRIHDRLSADEPLSVQHRKDLHAMMMMLVLTQRAQEMELQKIQPMREEFMSSMNGK